MIKCGFAQSIYTPSRDGIFMDGYGHRRTPSIGVLDDLYVKTAVFEDETGKRFALVAFDVCGMNQQVYKIVADHISIVTGISVENMSICATHTHAGPACGVLEIDAISQETWEYTGKIAADTVNKAISELFECTICSGISDVEFKESLNRRGRPYIDRRIKTILFKDGLGKLKGVISNASCHPVINVNFDFSADYPSVLTKEAEKQYGVPFIFLQGRGADINPIVNNDLTIEENINVVGKNLVEAVFSSVEKTKDKTKDVGKIKSAYKWYKLPMAKLDSVDVLTKKYEDSIKEYSKFNSIDEGMYHIIEVRWNRMLLNKALKGESPDIKVPLQVMSLENGPIFAFIPFELLTITGNTIEEFFISNGYKAEDIFVIGYANSVNSYLAPVEELPFGGYETGGVAPWYNITQCSTETEPAVIDGIKELFEEGNK